jgi:hypothetical protein
MKLSLRGSVSDAAIPRPVPAIAEIASSLRFSQ